MFCDWLFVLSIDASTYAHFLFNAFDTDHNGSVSFEVSPELPDCSFLSVLKLDQCVGSLSKRRAHQTLLQTRLYTRSLCNVQPLYRKKNLASSSLLKILNIWLIFMKGTYLLIRTEQGTAVIMPNQSFPCLMCGPLCSEVRDLPEDWHWIPVD